MTQTSQIHRPVVLVALLFLGFTAMIPSTAGHPPEPCSVLTYSADYQGRLFSLLKNNSTMIGNEIVFESDCEFSYRFDDGPSFTAIGNHTSPLDPITQSISITIDNTTTTYSSLTIYPSSLIQYGEAPPPETSQKTDDEIWLGEIFAHAITFLILYFFSTTVIYQIAKKRVDDSITVVV